MLRWASWSWTYRRYLRSSELCYEMFPWAARGSSSTQGCPFLFDRAGVTIVPGSGSGCGCVLLSGTLPTNGQRYQLSMRPTRDGRAVAVAATPTGAMKDLAYLGQKKELENAGEQSRTISRPGWTAAAAGSIGAESLATAGSGEEDPLVSEELSRFFSGLLVDLQGAELTFDSMRISRGLSSDSGQRGLIGSETGDVAASGPVRSSGSIARGRFGGISVDDGEAVLELDLRATIRSFPPLDVRF
ncbi:hypothetical protein Vretimale_4328 [Volvox reticuliferus]|uniref:Uncharacterized protein n=3 Tax=Volvox reticuliferus TaxID=1737510 RepID=A0A8J4G4Z2_9CHLO|nr:hypothetical protein Vretifemale_2893 [Volvox reticuliferus]GIL99078.1 hypothetical protein Vretimale_4328 [Volvox reticuliferus]